MPNADPWDAVVVGGGHNGLVAAAYLARAGARTLVCEARHKTGGAATTDAPWPDAPEIKVTRLSYVMSLMPPSIIRDLELVRHGYKVHPMGPYYQAWPDGRSLKIHADDAARNHDEIARFSKRDADAMPRWDAWLGGIADVLAPLLTRLLTMSITDLLDDWFESEQVKASLAINGVIGTWAGPDEPGTAYVMAHHSIGDVGDGHMGSWGFPEGGMGAVADAIRRSAEAAGSCVRTGAPVEHVIVQGGHARGVVLAGGEEVRAPVVVSAVHPRLTFLEQVDRAELPAEFVADVERWRSRSGVVKINLALAELPDFSADPGSHPQEHHSGAIELALSPAYVEQAFQDAKAGRGAERPFVDGCIPSVLDPTLCPDGVHVMSLFAQWCPHEWAWAPHREELEAFADRVVAGYTELAPNLAGAILHREVLGPWQMEQEYGLVGGNIFHGELSLEQLFHQRPAPGYADYRSPVKGLYQASSATHGGGGVCGIPGHHAARAALADHRRALARRRARR